MPAMEQILVSSKDRFREQALRLTTIGVHRQPPRLLWHRPAPNGRSSMYWPSGARLFKYRRARLSFTIATCADSFVSVSENPASTQRDLHHTKIVPTNNANICGWP